MDVRHEISKLAGKMISPIRAGNEKLAALKEGPAPSLGVTSSAFSDGAAIPERFVGPQGASPALSWNGIPAGAQELVLLCEDPDAPFPKPFVHWLLYGLKPSTDSLTENSMPPSGALVGKNSTGKAGYTGPKPPPGHGVHHYHFQVFALDAPLGLGPNLDRDALVDAMHGHVLTSGELVGTYEAK